MGDLVVHPDDSNLLYLGTEFGCYRSLNGGGAWERWNNGMPQATIVTELGYADRRQIDGTFLILAATYGRGVWARNILGDDPIAVPDVAPGAPARITSLRSHPNPFRGTTTISFDLSGAAPVELQVYDVSGRVVATLAQGTASAGAHAIRFDGSKLAAGVYWTRLRSGGVEEVRKLTVVK
jgi:hypothetical protein